MSSLLLNKKVTIIFTIVILVVVTNYAKAGCDLRMYEVRIIDRKSHYHAGDSIKIVGTAFVVKLYEKLEEPDKVVLDFYAGDYHIGSMVPYYVISSNGQVHFNDDMDWTIPNDMPAGSYAISAKITCAEDYNPDNDIAYATPDIIVQEIPLYGDLSITAVSAISPWSSDLFNQGGEIKFGFSIDNLDPVASDSYAVNFSVGNYFIGSVSCSPIGPYETFNINETEPFVVPLNVSSGSYTITGEVVCLNDGLTSNNIKQSAERIRVATLYQDISVIFVSTVGNNFKPGDSISVNAIIKNVGTFVAENINAEFYLGEDVIGSTNASDLNPELTETLGAECKIPDNLPDGFYTVKVRVTCNGDIDSSNNVMESGTSFWIGEIADLEVKSVQAANGTYMPGDMLTIYGLVKNIGDDVSNAYSVDYYLSTDSIITTWDYHIGHVNRGALEPGEQHSYNTTFKLPPNLPASNYYVGLNIICQEENNSGNNSGFDSETIGIIHPANYVCGQVKYEYPGYNDQAVRYALLKVYDKNNSTPNREIAQTYTDQNGNYGVVVLRDTMSAQSIYVKVFTDSISGAYPETIGKICSVKDDVSHAVYSIESSLYLHPQDSSRTIDVRVPLAQRAFMVYDSMVEAFHQAKTFFGIEMEEITTYWPSSANGTYYYPSEGIFISKDDEWDRDIILHEYGHYIAEVYNFAQGDVGENPTHYWDMDLRTNPVARTEEHAANLAFRESWPTLFSITSQLANHNYPHSGDAKYQDYYSYYNWTYEFDLEEDTFDNDSPGEYYDNMNCCLLWDIFDDHPDRSDFKETISDPNLYKIWNVVRGYKPENMNDFWIGWHHRYGQEEDIEGVIDIFQQHRMTFAESGAAPGLPQNHAPVAAAGQDRVVSQNRADGAMVHLDASGSYDPDGDAISHIWRHGYIRYNSVQLDILLPVGKTELELEVSDGTITSWDTVAVTVTPTN
ncbi:MAG: hypothetical protein JW787_03920 [Sedimentisphaerales bacterium]|nr:hypothetical protein [Sedimentisphaerales bacterium]